MMWAQGLQPSSALPIPRSAVGALWVPPSGHQVAHRCPCPPWGQAEGTSLARPHRSAPPAPLPKSPLHRKQLGEGAPISAGSGGHGINTDTWGNSRQPWGMMLQRDPGGGRQPGVCWEDGDTGTRGAGEGQGLGGELVPSPSSPPGQAGSSSR